ncbi:MAG: TetR/AcrR family transcriptional regulator [Clostridiales bacterium]|jgi:AcrR family transcriptional regulator|nr:TetR/AcrR family transcriptional regulator [Clostridiales bacterium]
MMGKAFSETETVRIRHKLRSSCEALWGRYGYKKTSVSELCKMAGISTGAFYSFYPSKAMLFLDTVDNYGDELMSKIKDYLPENPTKRDLAKYLKMMAKDAKVKRWTLSYREDYDMIRRELPDELLHERRHQDFVDMEKVLNTFGQKLLVGMGQFLAVITAVYLALCFQESIGMLADFDTVIEFLLDTAVEKMFE